jgi:hypothetical protein
MVNFEPASVPLTRLLVDPNNFRFSAPGEVVSVAEPRFGEDKVQAAALQRIKDDGVGEVKRSIAENGFVPVERIVVRALANEADEYVVVEGNRRTAALKLLAQDHAGGIDLDPRVIEVFEAVPVLVASDADDDDLLAIMGIRHVGGPKEWGGYQSALLVSKMLSKPDLSSRQVASRLGLTVNEVNRRHRALSALTQMTDDEEYGEFVSPEMYPIFHETIGQPIVREWLGWSQQEREFTNVPNREHFYSWLRDSEGGPKIRSYGEVRELKLILDNEDALTALKDDDQSFSDALAIVRADAKAARWLPNAKSALASLNDMGSDAVESLTVEDIDVLDKLRRRAAWIIKANAVSDDTTDDEQS